MQWKESNESEIVIKMSMAELKMQDGRNLLNTWTEKIESVRGMKRNEVQTGKTLPDNDDKIKNGEMHLLEIFFWDSSNWALKHSGPCLQFSNYNDNDVSFE